MLTANVEGMADGCFGGLAAALIAGLVPLAGCSLVLDFGAQEDGGAGDDAPRGDGSSVDPCLSFEPNDTLGAAGELVAGPRAAGICPETDRDFYAFSIADGDGVAITLMQAGDLDLDLRVHDVASEELVSVSTGSGDEERIEHRPELGNALPAGDYAVEVFAFGGTGDGLYTIDGSFERVPTADAGP